MMLKSGHHISSGERDEIRIGTGGVCSTYKIVEIREKLFFHRCERGMNNLINFGGETDEEVL